MNSFFQAYNDFPAHKCLISIGFKSFFGQAVTLFLIFGIPSFLTSVPVPTHSPGDQISQPRILQRSGLPRFQAVQISAPTLSGVRRRVLRHRARQQRQRLQVGWSPSYTRTNPMCFSIGRFFFYFTRPFPSLRLPFRNSHQRIYTVPQSILPPQPSPHTPPHTPAASLCVND